MEKQKIIEKDPKPKKSDLIVITGRRRFHCGESRSATLQERDSPASAAVDKKPLYQWYLRVPGVEKSLSRRQQ